MKIIEPSQMISLKLEKISLNRETKVKELKSKKKNLKCMIHNKNWSQIQQKTKIEAK